MNGNKIELFPTPVWGFVLHGEKYHAFDYINEITKLESTDKTVVKSNSGGFQSHDNLHQLPVFAELISTLETIGSDCIQKPVIITDMWANINYRNCHNYAHTHGGALSGVFYLEVPPNSGRLVLCNPAVRSDGHVLRSPNYPIVPENLALIVFPSWLEHYVEPNLSEDRRISISFNFAIKK